MNTPLFAKAQQYFQEVLGVPLDDLLSPITQEQPTGKSVRANGVYSAIKEARREDDPTLPMGAWSHELKQADWPKVSDIAVHALMSKSKDLQLVAWLFEAQLNQHGFKAIGACLTLMQSLCSQYWDNLYPRIDEGDQEYRANVLHWVNDKLLPQIRLLSITSANRDAPEYGWGDYEHAKLQELALAKHPARKNQEQVAEGPTLADFQSHMSATATDDFQRLYHTLHDALMALEALVATLDEHWQEQAPSLNNLASLLEQIQALVAGELYKRGIRLASHRSADEDPGSPPAPDGASGDGGSDGGGGEGPIRSREDAYHRLAVIADYLANREPHSPVPALILRAVEWGNMNTAELYNEVFVKFGGNLNLFELLGLEMEERN
ncbi:type VI secretion system protein TssA [Gallaecimonas mangrovi]|uniref:type VI secretion system protein TssA n=1 Tax=Gallaecimonas mangrovi TaxID=2291597 RepID=UPI000E203D82|nr:type VI secretion system protein TssA [Gallaecimonas mangrovi]